VRAYARLVLVVRGVRRKRSGQKEGGSILNRSPMIDCGRRGCSLSEIVRTFTDFLEEICIQNQLLIEFSLIDETPLL